MQKVTQQLPTIDGITVIDIETTGLHPGMGANIVEIAMIDISLTTLRKRTVLNTCVYQSMLREELEDTWICKNGFLTPDEILAGKDPKEVAFQVKARMGNWLWTSYNAYGFEYPFLQRWPWQLSSPAFCLMDLMKWQIGDWPHWANEPRKKKLDDAYRFIGKNPTNAHRAPYDCEKAAEILIWLIQKNLIQKDKLGYLMIPPIERPQCSKCKTTMDFDIRFHDWDCQRCRDYHFHVGRYY